MLVTAAAGQLYCWECQCRQQWQSSNWYDLARNVMSGKGCLLELVGSGWSAVTHLGNIRHIPGSHYVDHTLSIWQLLVHHTAITFVCLHVMHELGLPTDAPRDAVSA